MVTFVKSSKRFAALALLVPALAACGGTGTTTSPTAATSATSAPAATAMMEPTAAPMATTMTAPTAAAEPTSGTTAGAMTELPDVDPATVSGDMSIAGSSTVFPLTQRMAERFTEDGYTGNPAIESIGTGAGIERFCNGEIDIANASRAIKEEETAKCAEKNITPVEFRVGTDALTIVINPENTWATDLTLDQLAAIYSGEAKTWADVDPSYPADAIQVFSPGSDSGTFDFFAEKVFATDYKADKQTAYAKILNLPGVQLSENDNVLVQGVEGNKNAIGYFGYAYFQENEGKLKALSVDGIEPNEETAESGDYELSRPLFIYSDATIMANKPQVAAFINYYLTNVNDEILEVGYFPASEEALNEAKTNLMDASK